MLHHLPDQRLYFIAGANTGREGTIMAKYEVAICGGRIVDGAGNPWYYSDIGVRDYDAVIRRDPQDAVAYRTKNSPSKLNPTGAR